MSSIAKLKKKFILMWMTHFMWRLKQIFLDMLKNYI